MHFPFEGLDVRLILEMSVILAVWPS